MSSKFRFCFLGDVGNMVCQHWNGSWIVFPATKENEKATLFKRVAVSKS